MRVDIERYREQRHALRRSSTVMLLGAAVSGSTASVVLCVAVLVVAYPANVDPGGMPYALGAFGLASAILGSSAIALLIPGLRRRRRLWLLRDVAALVQLVGEPTDEQIRDAGLDLDTSRALLDEKVEQRVLIRGGRAKNE